ncbi:MAG: MarR family winged helix-turn-helix transcriptional regulator [Solirubrobacteraceae bacterium]|nr:MAG: MarR family transcriptional regulator [Solirubrobacterales bacterium]
MVDDEPKDGAVPVLDSTPPLRSVGFTISATGYAIARTFKEILAPLQLEPREFSLLRAVGAAEGQSQQTIGERLQIPSSRMVAFVDALEARGLLQRRQNPDDRRARALFLTEDGHELLERSFTAAAGHELNLTGELSPEERDQLLALLEKVGNRLGLAGGNSGRGHPALADE